MESKPRLGREPVVRAGLKLLNEAGLDGLTLRAIAAELGVQAPTLYWRFKNKQDLVDEMSSQVLADYTARMLETVPPGATWRAWIELYAHGLRSELLRYRDGARMVAGTQLRDPAVYGGMEAALRVFAAAGVAPSEAAMVLKTIQDFVFGFTIEQQAVISPSGERDPRFDLAQRETRLDPARYPLARSVGRDLLYNYDLAFARGVGFIVAGFAAALPREGPAWRDFQAGEIAQI